MSFYKKSLQHYLDEVLNWNIEAGHVQIYSADQLDVWEGSEKVRAKAFDLIQEEVDELYEAVMDDDQVEILDALGDILFTVFGLAAKSGHMYILEEGLQEIISSNLTKLGGDKTDPSVKVGKPKGYKPPNLERIVKDGQKRGFIS